MYYNTLVVCMIMAHSVLQGDPIPTDACDTAYANLFFGDDQCAINTQEVVFNSNDSLSAILGLYEGDCPAKFEAYATACSDEAENNPVSEKYYDHELYACRL